MRSPGKHPKKVTSRVMSAEHPKCPYEILGVLREATEVEIKKAYRRLAILHHPDKNEGKAEATEMFQRIGAAYAILSNEEKRERYDRTGCLDEEEMQETNMDDIMQMFMHAFGGDMMFGGMPMMFEVHSSGHRGRASHFGGADIFSQMFSDMGDFSEDEDGFQFFMGGSDDDDDEEDGFEQQLAEVIPGLFCQYFMEEVPNDRYKCTICGSVVNGTDQAEYHFMECHAWLMNRFVELLEQSAGRNLDIMDLFEEFATAIKSGQVREPKKKKKKFQGPRVRSRRQTRR